MQISSIVLKTAGSVLLVGFLLVSIAWSADPQAAFGQKNQGTNVMQSKGIPAAAKDVKRPAKPCEHGTLDAQGVCLCAPGFAGTKCDSCAPDYYGYPVCKYCSPAKSCSSHGTCTTTGDCVCTAGFAGTKCDSCAPGHYNWPLCRYCSPASSCSGHGTCTPTGDCVCETGYIGVNCSVKK